MASPNLGLRSLASHCTLITAACAVLGLSACAVDTQPGDEIGSKAEPVLGAACTDDTQCDASEICERPVCITHPCDTRGHCAPQFNFQAEPFLAIPDNDSRGVEQTFQVVNPGASVVGLSVNVRIDHTYRGDLRVALTSPSGTEVVLHDRAGGSADDLLISDVHSEFNGEPATGTWRLSVSDHAAADLGTLEYVRLVFIYGSAPDTSNEVWASVPLSGIASAHNYANNTNRVWDLTRFAGSAERSRLRFSRIDVEQSWDFVEILNADTGSVLQRITGSHTNFVSDAFNTGRIWVRLVTDGSVVRWGFEATTLEVFGAGCLEDSDCTDGRYCPVTQVCVTSPCFQSCVPRSVGSEPGDPCASDSDCRDAMYCGVDGTCRVDGTCGEVSDCGDSANAWYHIMCAGYPTCESNTCGWQCGVFGGEGSACTDSNDCRLDLYCGASETCTAAGACTEDSDCNRSDNPFLHPACAGTGYCGTSGQCGWDCTPEPVCRDGETTFDGCNTCTCSGGLWACTRRACPVTAGEGERCGGADRVVCDAGLTCDHDVAETCGDAFPAGTCIAEPTGTCAEIYSPVCGCNGQTFENDCSRQGNAGLAHAGRCTLDRAIPDNDTSGISVSVDAQALGVARYAAISVEIDHTWRGDLVVTLTAPDGRRYSLTNRAGGSADDFVFNGTADLGTTDARGTWTLHVSDHAGADTGTLRYFNVAPR